MIILVDVFKFIFAFEISDKYLLMHVPFLYILIAVCVV